MTAPHDLDRQLDAFLQDGPSELPDPSFDAVRDHIEVTRQRVVVGPWRVPDMNKLVPIGVGAAALVVVAVVGAQLLGVPAPGGAGAPPPATPSPSPVSSVAAPLPSEGSVFVLSTETSPLTNGVPSTVTIAAPGWEGEPGSGILINGVDPDGAGLIGPWHEPLYIYGDPCRWSTTRPEAPATTVESVVTALTAQASREATTPVDVTLDGYTGRMLTLHVPDNLESSQGSSFSDCDEGKFGSWSTSAERDPGRYHQFPGQIDEVWVVDIDGQAAVFDGSYAAGTPAETVAEMRAIIESIDFQP
jgi:hypothetical protein